MQASVNSILFEKQPHQEECIKNLMSALERNNKDHRLVVKPDHSFSTAFPKKPDNQIDVLMETGTGKTFIYLKAMFEMHKRFGMTKFIIIVPRTSIKLGVAENVRLTNKTFFDDYKMRLKCVKYPEVGPEGVLRDFLGTSDLSVLLITNSAFNSKDKLINKIHERLDGNMTIWDEIIKIAPTVIIDEPHLLVGNETKKYLSVLREKSLFMRFGATYPDGEDGCSNVVHVLDSITAFNKKLVKRIYVHTVDSATESGNMRVVETHMEAFRIAYMINGQSRVASARLGDDLYAVTGIPTYRGRSVTKVDSKGIVLDDGTRIQTGAYSLTDDEMREMIRETIRLHFERELKMFPMGIKTLSLFFIPNVHDFRERGENVPKVKAMFDEEYVRTRKTNLNKDISDEYRAYIERDYQDGELVVREGYFSGDKGSKDKRESDGVDTILNNKTKLLSFDKPLRFIFSVWALQEGWDNPNVFNICKLSHTGKETSRRQQVGRGLRIPVNIHGLRMTEDRLAASRIGFYDVNELNMVVSAHEGAFIDDIQREIHDASIGVVNFVVTLNVLKNNGLDDMEASMIFVELSKNGIIDSNGHRNSSIHEFLESNRDLFPTISNQRFEEIVKKFQDAREAVRDGRKPEKMVRVRLDKWKEFRHVWEIMNRESSINYKNVDENEIIQSVRNAFNSADIPKAQTVVTKQVYDSEKDEIKTIDIHTSDDATYFQNRSLHDNIMNIASEHKWPIGFLLKLFNSIDAAKFKSNPSLAEKRLVEIIQDSVHGTILKTVEYEFSETTVYCNKLQNGDGNSVGKLPYTDLGKKYDEKSPRKEFLYDTAVYDAEIERKSIHDDPVKFKHNEEKIGNITVFAKLPRINIPTPYKTYNPDFAYVVGRDDGQTLFLVVETKGYDNETDVPDDEQKKIDYGHKFFESLQKTLPESTQIKFRRRLNVDELSDIVLECCSK